MGFLCLIRVLAFRSLCPSSFSIILMWKRELVALLMSCDSQCSMAFPHGAMGLSVVCDCGIS